MRIMENCRLDATTASRSGHRFGSARSSTPRRHQLGHRIVDDVHRRGYDRHAAHEVPGALVEAFECLRRQDLDVGLSRPHELQQFGEARLLRPELRLRAAEMVEHDRHSNSLSIDRAGDGLRIP
jgi:hypothetical protein